MLFYFALILVPLLCYFCVKTFGYWHAKGVKQASTWTSIKDTILNTLKLKSFRDIHTENYCKYPKSRYIGIYQFSQPMLMIRDPELLKHITVKDIDYFVERQSVNLRGNDEFWDRNLMGLPGDQWRIMRSTLSPAFTATKMKAMFVLMNETAEDFTNFFLQGPQRAVHQMKDCYRRYGNDVIANCAFGVKCNSLTDRNNDFYKYGILLTDFTSFWRQIKIVIAAINQRLGKIVGVKAFNPEGSKFFFNLVKEQLKIRQEQNIVRPDMIHLLLEARKGLLGQDHEDKVTEHETGFATAQESYFANKKDTDNKKDFSDVDITAQVMFFFAAGFDTTSSGMSFISYELALHPDIQQRLREEIDDTIDKFGGKLTYEALFGMKYMDMVISEALRKWPPALFVDRKVVKTYNIKKSSEYEDEADELLLNPNRDVVLISINDFHHDPKYYPNPEVFDPERFSDENKKNINAYAYMPFGLGPRNCIASRFALMEMKTLFFHLLSKFEIVVDKSTQIPVQLSKGLFNLDSVDGIWLAFKKRE